MKIYLYLPPTELDSLRHAHLHLVGVNQFLDPYQQNARTIERKLIRISDEAFEQELKRQFQALPAHIQNALSWDSFRQKVHPKRPQIEAQMQKRLAAQARILPDPQTYVSLAFARFFARGNNPLLWEYFADQHRGMVLEFDAAHPEFCPGKQILRPVVYVKARPHVGHAMKPFPALFHRPPEYALQEELCMLRPIDEAKAEQAREEGTHYLYPFAPESLISVTLGANASTETRQWVTDIMRYDIRYKSHCALREVLLDPDEFELHVNPV